jgi:amino acid permease
MSIYFPHTEKAKRLTSLHGSIESLIYDPEQNDEHMWVLYVTLVLFWGSLIKELMCNCVCFLQYISNLVSKFIADDMVTALGRFEIYFALWCIWHDFYLVGL